MADDNPLVLDELSARLDRFHTLALSDESAADTLLNQMGGSGRVERQMLTEMSAPRPLAHPERFWEAHSVAMRALEVLARNGGRAPSQLRAGPLTGPARWLAQQIVRYLVRSHQREVIDAVRDVYVRRLGWTPPGTAGRLELARARIDVERAMPAFKKSTGGLPTFLVGGAALSSFAQVGRGLAGATGAPLAVVIAGGIVAFLVLAAASWAILRGAAIARRRIRLTLDQPLAALWETIGWCGHPPHDNTRTFAIVALVLTVVAWVLLPAATVVLTLL